MFAPALRLQSVLSRRLPFALLLLAGMGAAQPAQPFAPATGPWIISSGPEAADARALGAELRDRAQAFAAQKKYSEALPLLEELDRTLPSAEHDCLLALGYFRTNQLTRAQLFWDLGGLRNGTRPNWCLAELPKQIAGGLRELQFVALTLDVQPPEATLELAGMLLRGVPVVWLGQGTYRAIARVAGRPDVVAHVVVAAPSAALVLNVPPAPEPRHLVDAPIVEHREETELKVPPAEAPPPAPPLVLSQPVVVERTSRTPGWAALGVAGVTGVVGGIFHGNAASLRETANRQVQGSPAFNHSVSDFQVERGVAIGCYAVSAVALSVAIYWLSPHGGEGDAAVSLQPAQGERTLSAVEGQGTP